MWHNCLPQALPIGPSGGTPAPFEILNPEGEGNCRPLNFLVSPEHIMFPNGMSLRSE